jgi:hypothetical protein
MEAPFFISQRYRSSISLVFFSLWAHYNYSQACSRHQALPKQIFSCHCCTAKLYIIYC